MRLRSYQGVASLILVLAPICSGQAKNPCRTVRLPAGVTAFLGEKYADWRIKNVSDLDADDRALWVKAHPRACPGIAIGHFEESDRLSYAVLVVPKEKIRQAYKIIILKVAPPGNTYTGEILDQSDVQYSGSGLVISKAPPGKYSDFEGTAQVQVNLDAISVEWIEKASVVYYRVNGQYRKIQTAD